MINGKQNIAGGRTIFISAKANVHPLYEIRACHYRELWNDFAIRF
jgi:hypothetical protein